MGGGGGGFQDRNRKDGPMKVNGFDSRDRSRSNMRPSYRDDNKFPNGNSNNRDSYQNHIPPPPRMREDDSKGAVSSSYQTAPSKPRYSRFDNNSSSSSSKIENHGASYQAGGYGNKPKAYGGYENGGSNAASGGYSGAQQSGSAAYNTNSAAATPVFTSFTLQTKMFQFPPPPLPVTN